MDLYIKTNIHPSFLFPPPPHYFKGTFAIFPKGYFIMTLPVYENLKKYPSPPCLLFPTTINHKRVIPKQLQHGKQRIVS